MNTKIAVPLLIAFLTISGNARAEGASVTITQPMNNAMVGTHDNFEISYMATPGPDGDHLHLYLDGNRIDILRPMKGTADVGMLPAGKHKVCLTVNTRSHAPTGAEACIEVTAK